MPEATPRTVETYVTRDGKDVFQEWLDGLADQRAKMLIDKTVAKVRLGNLGQHKSVGEGVQEIVLDYAWLPHLLRRTRSDIGDLALRKREKKAG